MFYGPFRGPAAAAARARVAVSAFSKMPLFHSRFLSCLKRKGENNNYKGLWPLSDETSRLAGQPLAPLGVPGGAGDRPDPGPGPAGHGLLSGGPPSSAWRLHLGPSGCCLPARFREGKPGCPARPAPRRRQRSCSSLCWEQAAPGGRGWGERSLLRSQCFLGPPTHRRMGCPGSVSPAPSFREEHHGRTVLGTRPFVVGTRPLI